MCYSGMKLLHFLELSFCKPTHTNVNAKIEIKRHSFDDVLQTLIESRFYVTNHNVKTLFTHKYNCGVYA